MSTDYQKLFNERVKTKHLMERVLDAMDEVFDRRLKILDDWATLPDGRAMFEIPVTDEEEWQRYMNKDMRQAEVARLQKEEGAGAVDRYLTRMRTATKKFHPEMLGE